MSAFIEPIEVAVFMFPFLALLLSLPIFVKQYRQYGCFILSRGIIIYTFIFYLLPNVLGRGMGQLAKGLNSLNHHIQQMALLFFFLISGYFFSLLFKFTDHHYLNKKVFFYEKASHNHVESRLHVEIT